MTTPAPTRVAPAATRRSTTRPGTNPACDARRGAGNTNDLRGKILRIPVNEDGSYSIPQGNLFPESEDTQDKTRPEIYIMGVRNPFRIQIDDVTGTLIWGDYAPDAGRDDPGAGRWAWSSGTRCRSRRARTTAAGPTASRDNRPYNNWDFVNSVPREWFDCSAPRNTSRNNTGLVELPPVVPADVWYGDRNCMTTAPEDCDNPQWPELTRFSENIEQAPMAGPVYRYDASSPSDDEAARVLGRQGVPGRVLAELRGGAYLRGTGRARHQDRELPARPRPGRQRLRPVEPDHGPGVRARRLAVRDPALQVAWSASTTAPATGARWHGLDADPTSGGAAPLTVSFDASDSTDPETRR